MMDDATDKKLYKIYQDAFDLVNDAISSTQDSYCDKIWKLEEENRNLKEQVASFECLLKRKYTEIAEPEKEDEDEEGCNTDATVVTMRACGDCNKEFPIETYMTICSQTNKRGEKKQYKSYRRKCNACRWLRQKKAKLSNEPVVDLSLTMTKDEQDDDRPQFESGESSGSDHVVNDLLYMGKITNPDLTINRL